VRWEGEASDERLASLLRGATALAYPSLGEGFGLPVVEAMAEGIPVLTSAGTACADVAGDAGWIVDPYDVDAIADGLARLVDDSALRATLAARGRAKAGTWSWTRTAEGTREAYVRATA
jgi:glycosyltransferase involved in cell wall biosynthesis